MDFLQPYDFPMTEENLYESVDEAYANGTALKEIPSNI